MNDFNYYFKSFDAVTILFSELVGLSASTVQETMHMVTTMNEVFSCFDSLMDEHRVYKVNRYKNNTRSLFIVCYWNIVVFLGGNCWCYIYGS